jgi:hypothetical protein
MVEEQQQHTSNLTAATDEAEEGCPHVTQECGGAPRWCGRISEPEGVAEVGLTCTGQQVAQDKPGDATSSLRDGQ